MKFLACLSCLLLAACAQTPVAFTGKSKPFGPLNPGGPVFQPTEMLVSEPPPADPPFGRYFANDRAPVPKGMKDPYWISGYWAWKDPYWEWVHGRWVERPRPGLIWINARHYSTGSRHYWVTGYWE